MDQGVFPTRTDFCRLFEEHGDNIRKRLRRYGGSRMPVEDGLQEVFLIALEDYRPPIPAEPWLLKTAFHVAHYWRRQARYAAALAFNLRCSTNGCERVLKRGDEQSGDEPAEDALYELSPEYWFTIDETRVHIHQVIDTLPAELREVFVLVEIEEVSLAKVAATLDLPLSTVRSRRKRAREAFLKEGRRRRAMGLLGVLALLSGAAAESRKRWRRDAGSALAGGAAVAALFSFAPEPPSQIPIHAEPPLITETRSIIVPAPAPREPPQHATLDPQNPIDAELVPVRPVLKPPQHARLDVMPLPVPQPAPPNPDETVRDEINLMDSAANARNQGRYRDALRYLAQHKHRYPEGRLADRREKMIREINSLLAG